MQSNLAYNLYYDQICYIFIFIFITLRPLDVYDYDIYYIQRFSEGNASQNLCYIYILYNYYIKLNFILII